jgi:hypothetical protein
MTLTNSKSTLICRISKQNNVPPQSSPLKQSQSE